jgi:CHAT domain-containing protein/tetratricopeptide (TPR) repeat protein
MSWKACTALTLTAILLGLATGAVGARETAPDLTPEQRARMQEQATEWAREAAGHSLAGRPAEALRLLRQVLEINKRLYPADQFPDGHADLAFSLNNVGYILLALGAPDRALPYHQQALAMRRQLYPADRFPDGHPELASSLNNLAITLQELGLAERAVLIYQEGLAMSRKLHPADRFPDGHPNIAHLLHNLASVHKTMGLPDRALAYDRQALEMFRKLYPPDRFPDGHRELAVSLNNLATDLTALGAVDQALACDQQAVEMFRKLYPPERFPNGHPELARSLDNLSAALQTMGSPEQALPLMQQALEMRRNLYPERRYPNGHPDLARGLDRMGNLLGKMFAPGRALPYHEQALALRRKLYPAERFPDGHPLLAQSLHNVARALEDVGQKEQALAHHRQALAMHQKLYPPERFPRGHANLELSLNDLGIFLVHNGDAGRGLAYCEQALAMARNLFPTSQYPAGHPNLADNLNNVGVLLLKQGQPERGLSTLRQAVEMEWAYLEAQAATAPEAQALQLLASLSPCRDDYLSHSRRLGTDPGEAYQPVWLYHAALTRVLQQRQRAARLGLADAKTPAAVRDRWQRLQDVRRRLSALPERINLPQADRDALFRDLTEQKETLERQLARDLPQLQAAPPRHADLRAGLPEGVAFIDFFRYVDSEKERHTDRYVAFVLGRDEPVRRVELGAADPLDGAIDRWRTAVREGKDGDAAAEVGSSLWPKLAPALPKGTHTLYLAPDVVLARLPWAALPIGPRRVLLEDYRLALVPHGPFLLEQLQALGKQPRLPDRAGRILAVGGVHDDLPAAQREVEVLQQQASPRDVLVLGKTRATPDHVLQELGRARYAHLATHGFFDEEQFNHEVLRSIEQRMTLGRARLPLGETASVGLGRRSPLIYTGLMLAADPGDPRASSRLTAETLVSQSLEGLELCVLSACETGLGALSGGEGVLGLQRAFHLAGCPNVVASLWNVNDEATAALMAVFYDRLWHKGEPPIEALRQGQLALYYHPERIQALARERGPKLKEAVDLPLGGKVAEDKESRRARTKLWAAFVLSGVGR